MARIEIHLGGKPVTKLQAARSVAAVGGESVVIGVPNEAGWIRDYVTVYARHWGVDGPYPANLSCSSFNNDDPAEIRQRIEMITIAAEIIELAAMIAAEGDALEGQLVSPGFQEGDEVTSPHFDGIGEVVSTRAEQGVTTVVVQLPEDSGTDTVAGEAGFAPEDLTAAGK